MENIHNMLKTIDREQIKAIFVLTGLGLTCTGNEKVAGIGLFGAVGILAEEPIRRMVKSLQQRNKSNKR